MRILSYISTLAITLVILTQSVSAGILTCPISFEEWEGRNTFYAGYEGLCSYYTALPNELKKEFKENGLYQNRGILSKFSFRKWKPIFENDWSNGSFLYRVEN